MMTEAAERPVILALGATQSGQHSPRETAEAASVTVVK